MDKTNTPPAPVIELTGVRVERGGRRILDDIDWVVPAGACAAVLGPNGSGKSTLARVVMGSIWPTHGTVRVLGRKFGETDLAELRRDVRIVQSNGPVELDGQNSAIDIVLTGFFGTVGLYDKTTPALHERANQLLAQVGMATEAAQPFRTLSSGERMRCLMARALVVEPRLLILDEVTAGLDLLAREQVLATVQQLLMAAGDSLSVVMITHHVEELLPQTSNVLILKDGCAAACGSPAEVFTPENLSIVYDFPVEVEQRGGRYWLQVHPDAWPSLLKAGTTPRQV